MLRLFVLRHAKSSWAVPGAIDMERELNERGFTDLEKMLQAIIEQRFQPDHVLCSTAIRTRQTLEGLRSALKSDVKVTFESRLYSGGTNDYLDIIKSHQTPESLMIIGHNPMCGSLVANLYGSGSEKYFARIALKYPTGTLSVLDFDIGQWSEIKGGTGELKACMMPRKLVQDQ